MKLILGGGIGGLSAAHYLTKKCPDSAISIIEATNRVGGWIKSTQLSDGTIFEQGPRTIRPKGLPGANTLQLLEELGLSNNIKPILSNHPAATKRMVYANSQLHTLPSKFSSIFVKQKPFSKPLIAYLLREYFISSKKAANDDESIYDFVSRRLGNEVGDYLISPMICGICGGNAKEISVKFLMESIFKKEQQFGSITKGIFKTLRDPIPKLPESLLLERSRKEKWSIYSFEGGIEKLTQTLHEANINSGCNMIFDECIGIEFKDNVELIMKNGSKLKGEHLFSALPAEKLGLLVEKQHPKLGELLKKIENVSLAVVNLKFKGKLLEQEAFGFLVAPKENLPILGVIYDSCCFPNGDDTVLTTMMGGHWFQHHFKNYTTEEMFLNKALEQIRNILGIKIEPDSSKVNILKNCIPQYKVGHAANLEQINEYIQTKGLKLSLCGSSYYGVGVNDVILSAKNAVEKIN